MRIRTGSDWLEVTLGTLSRAGIPGKFSRADSGACACWAAVLKPRAEAPGVPGPAHRAPARYSIFIFIIFIIKVIKVILDISRASRELLA